MPVARLPRSSTSMRSGDLRSRDGLGSPSSTSESAAGCTCRARFASGGLVWRRDGVACSDACSDQACAFLATAAGALLVLRRVTRACSLFSCCVLALHRREAPLRSAGSPAHGPAPHAANNRNAGKWSAFMCSHIPKIGGQAPVTLRYSDHECRRSVLNLRLSKCPSPCAHPNLVR